MPLPKRSHDGDGQQDGRECVKHIHGAHDDLVGEPCAVAGHQAQPSADDGGHADRHQANLQGDAGADDNAREDIAAEIVSAHQMREGGAGEAIAEVHGVGVIGRDGRAEQAHQRDQGQHDEAKHGQAMTQQTPPGIAPQGIGGPQGLVGGLAMSGVCLHYSPAPRRIRCADQERNTVDLPIGSRWSPSAPPGRPCPAREDNRARARRSGPAAPGRAKRRPPRRPPRR